MKLIFKFSVCFIFIFLTVCNKKNDSQQIGYLTNGKWRIVKLDVKAGITGTWTDGLAGMPDCKKDDEWIFLKSGLHEINEGASKCNAPDPQLIQSTNWTFSPDKTKIIFPGLLGEWVIEKLDAAQFISTSSQDIGPTTYYYRRTMQH